MTRTRSDFFIAVLTAFLLCICSELHAEAGKRKHTQTGRKDARGIIEELIGVPYERGPLGERENEVIYREDVFDCTTFVVTVAAKMNAGPESASEMMKQIHYYPPGKVSFATRLHFSSYRNRVSMYFEDITSDIGKGRVKREKVVLNRHRAGEGRLIDIDWEKCISFEYIPSPLVPDVVDKLPDIVGVGFVRTDLFEEGLAITHEGIVLDGRKLVHASLEKGEVVTMDFLNYLNRQDFSGVSFFRIKKVKKKNQNLSELKRMESYKK